MLYSKRKLGNTGPEVFPIALGCMGMSGLYGGTDEGESIATIHEALDRGINLIDTGDFYGMGHNELLVGRAIKGRRREALLSVKFGALRGPDGSWGGFDSRPAAIRNFLAYSLTRLGVDHIDIYRPARLDPQVPIEDTVGTLADLVKAGYVRYVGLSEVGPETIRRANAVHPIVDLQIEYAIITRKPEQSLFPVLQELGIGATVYGVLSRGLLAGSKPGGPGDFRAHMPRFTAENRGQNDRLIAALNGLAQRRSVTPVQLAVAWVMSKQDFVVPVMGARTRVQLHDVLGALEVQLSKRDLDEIESAISPDSVAGTRYDARQMQMLDSERV